MDFDFRLAICWLILWRLSVLFPCADVLYRLPHLVDPLDVVVPPIVVALQPSAHPLFSLW